MQPHGGAVAPWQHQPGTHATGCHRQGLEAKLQDLDDLRLAIPETTQFLHADLTQDPGVALDKAERAH
jgi:hypothetical protein